MKRFTLAIIREGNSFDHWRDIVSFAPQQWAPEEPIQVCFADEHRMTIFPGTATVIFEEDVSARRKPRRTRIAAVPDTHAGAAHRSTTAGRGARGGGPVRRAKPAP